MIMKKTSFIIISALVLGACSKDPITEPTPTPENKSIEFMVGAGADYSAPAFSDVTVSVSLTVSMMRKSDGSTSVVWDTLYSAPLQSFPRNDNPQRKLLTVTNNRPDLQNVHVSYAVRYFKNGQPGAQHATGSSLENFEQNKTVRVNL
jgi:hypothetical protein